MSERLTVEELGALRAYYEPPATPACRVCGGEMGIGSMGGGGPTIWHCSSDDADWLSHGERSYGRDPHPRYDHWEASTYHQPSHGDGFVVRAVDELLAFHAAEQTEETPT